MLIERWREASEGEGQVVLLSGEAGIGKSRILAGCANGSAASRMSTMRYQCSPHHVNDAFYPSSEQIWHTRGLSAANRRRRGSKAGDDDRAFRAGAKEIAPSSPRLLSIPIEGRYPALEMAPSEQKERTIAALMQVFAGLTKTRPCWLLLEDAHWIDPTSLDVFSRLVDRLPEDAVRSW